MIAQRTNTSIGIDFDDDEIRSLMRLISERGKLEASDCTFCDRTRSCTHFAVGRRKHPGVCTAFVFNAEYVDCLFTPIHGTSAVDVWYLHLVLEQMEQKNPSLRPAVKPIGDIDDL